ncbi:Loganic acid O-methyltransferase [Camellia lanceoleosa]|uniref:Loganic acid O-methyltransferase n=1 Tax=Camellia lanceoleosa TaxID=1840588 RepID=A0ACC0I740_9ERIC|nr:Loganic acid O-methyltransferase [Camellia lanceoleosa]
MVEMVPTAMPKIPSSRDQQVKAKVNSFNLPVYAASPKEMKKLVEINGCFYIEKMESTGTRSKIDGPVNMKTLIEQLRAGFERIFTKRFGSDIIDELFRRILDKIVEISSQFEPGCMRGTQLFLALKRK